MATPYDEFSALVRPWLDGYDRVRVSAIGVKKGDARHVLSAKIELVPTFDNVSLANRELNDAIFWGRMVTAAFSSKDFTALVQGFMEGRIEIGGVHGTLPADHSTNPPSPWFYSGHPPRELKVHQGPRRPHIKVTRGSRNVCLYQEIGSQEVEWHLHTHKPPYRNLRDLYEDFDLPHDESNDATLIELHAPSPIELTSESRLNDGRVSVSLKAAPAISRRDVSVGYVAETMQGPQRGNIESSSIVWEHAKETSKAVVQLPVSDCLFADCFLTFSGKGVQHIRVAESKRKLNMRAAIQNAYDPGLAKLRQLLLEAKSGDTKRFEDAVAILLTMLGFNVAPHGRAKKLDEAPDIAAITPSGKVAIVECTVDLPNKGEQVATVLKRTEFARRSLDAAGWNETELLPVIVTLLPAGATGGHKEEAELRNVLVLCAEDLEAALERAKDPINADQVFAQWQQRLGAFHLVLARTNR